MQLKVVSLEMMRINAEVAIDFRYKPLPYKADTDKTHSNYDKELLFAEGYRAVSNSYQLRIFETVLMDFIRT